MLTRVCRAVPALLWIGLLSQASCTVLGALQAVDAVGRLTVLVAGSSSGTKLPQAPVCQQYLGCTTAAEREQLDQPDLSRTHGPHGICWYDPARAQTCTETCAGMLRPFQRLKTTECGSCVTSAECPIGYACQKFVCRYAPAPAVVAVAQGVPAAPPTGAAVADDGIAAAEQLLRQMRWSQALQAAEVPAILSAQARRAWMVIGIAGCHLHDVARVQHARDHLQGADRELIERLSARTDGCQAPSPSVTRLSSRRRAAR